MNTLRLSSLSLTFAIAVSARAALFLFVVASATLPGCSEGDQIPVGFVDRESGDIVVQKTLFKEKFDDGTRIADLSIEKHDNGSFYLVRSGFDAKRNSVVTYSELTPGSHGALFFDMSKKGDKCEGDPCSYCAWSDASGCFCRKDVVNPTPDGKCNHSTIVGADIFKPTFQTP